LVSDRCGYCGKHLAVGDPLQLITLPELSRQLCRCAACADGPVPAHLPAATPRSVMADTWARWPGVSTGKV